MKRDAVGFTGTQFGLTVPQSLVLADLLTVWEELHHGDCLGADAEAAELAKAGGLWVVAHPPTNPAKRAFAHYDEQRGALPYLVRNQAIVDETRMLIACPTGVTEARRSGTWATVRYARSRGRTVIVIWPEGRPVVQAADKYLTQAEASPILRPTI